MQNYIRLEEDLLIEKKLTTTDKLVLGLLFSLTKKASVGTTVSQRQMARMLGLSAAAVSLAIKKFLRYKIKNLRKDDDKIERTLLTRWEDKYGRKGHIFYTPGKDDLIKYSGQDYLLDKGWMTKRGK